MLGERDSDTPKDFKGILSNFSMYPNLLFVVEEDLNNAEFKLVKITKFQY